MELVILPFLVMYTLSSLPVQAEVEVTIEEVECEFVNASYINDFAVNALDHSEFGSCLTGSGEITSTFPPGTEVLINVRKFYMGDYTLNTGINTEMELCSAVQGEVVVGGGLLEMLDFDEDNCPPKPGYYQIDCYHQTDEDNLPQVIKAGKYKVFIELLNRLLSIEILRVNFYVAVL